jgi:hypothetical protein
MIEVLLSRSSTKRPTSPGEGNELLQPHDCASEVRHAANGSTFASTPSSESAFAMTRIASPASQYDSAVMALLSLLNEEGVVPPRGGED